MNVIKQKSIGLLGIALSTVSAYKFLSKKGFKLFIWDDNPNVREKYKTDDLNIINFEDWNFSNLDCVIASPGIPLYYPKQHEIVKYLEKYNTPVITDIELFFNFFSNYKYIGITGSNGKSSLTTLIYETLKLSGKHVYMAGNIGIPIFSLNNLPDDAYIILELSSFQLSYLNKMKLNIACILNIEDNHNEYHGGFDNYQIAKFNIFKNQTEQDFTIIDLNESYYNKFNELYFSDNINSKGRIIKVATVNNKMADCFFNDNILYSKLPTQESKSLKEIDFTKQLSFKGKHYKQLLIFAYVISMLLKIDLKFFLESIRIFKNLPHRQEVVTHLDNIIVINDSKATTPAAAEVALSRFENIYWLVGGIRKSGNLDKCLLHKENINQVFIFGKDKLNFAKEFKGKVKFSCYNSLKEATDAAVKEACKNGIQIKNKPPVVLLSPIGTSLDEFSNFEARGNYFKQLIKELLNVSI